MSCTICGEVPDGVCEYCERPMPVRVERDTLRAKLERAEAYARSRGRAAAELSMELEAAEQRLERAEAALIDAVGLAEDLRHVPDHGEHERHRRTQRLLPLQRLRDALVEGKAAPPESDRD
jgi:hypothetical protein